MAACDDPLSHSCRSCCRSVTHETDWKCDAAVGSPDTATCCVGDWDAECWNVASAANHDHACNQCRASLSIKIGSNILAEDVNGVVLYPSIWLCQHSACPVLRTVDQNITLDECARQCTLTPGCEGFNLVGGNGWLGMDGNATDETFQWTCKLLTSSDDGVECKNSWRGRGCDVTSATGLRAYPAG